jgi:hypothetical protein
VKVIIACAQSREATIQELREENERLKAELANAWSDGWNIGFKSDRETGLLKGEPRSKYKADYFKLTDSQGRGSRIRDSKHRTMKLLFLLLPLFFSHEEGELKSMTMQNLTITTNSIPEIAYPMQCDKARAIVRAWIKQSRPYSSDGKGGRIVLRCTYAEHTFKIP